MESLSAFTEQSSPKKEDMDRRKINEERKYRGK